MTRILREGTPDTYSADSEALSKVLEAATWAGGSVEVTGAVTLTIVGTNRDNPATRRFVQCYDQYGNKREIVATAAGVWELPRIFGYRYIKLTASAPTEVYLFRAA
ncbi:MAG: hypothetical protein GXY58_08140 [Planctomycetaceae bacterium]|nr:hypothetical protein [Planctomycetaceae bacterium]